MNYHAERVHEYGETCVLYPCEECGFSGQDMKSLKDHTASVHNNTSKVSSLTSETSYEILLDSDLDGIEETIAMPKLIVSKRIVQNLKDIYLDEDSDDEWNPESGRRRNS